MLWESATAKAGRGISDMMNS